MRLSNANSLRIVIALGALLLLVPGSWATTKSSSHHSSKSSAKSRHSSATKSKSSSKSKHGKLAKKPRGQQAIDSDRTREIQSALIREHYLNGEPTGAFDSSTKAAMTKFQSDNGWQTKVVPDSRALIKLGLGPSREGLLNPETAAMGAPHELGVEKEIPGGSVPPHK